MVQGEEGRRERSRHATGRGTPRVLVVDDDLPQRGLLSSALKQSGYHVLIAGDGDQAERAVSLHQPDVVLLDLMMPGVDGWEFLRRLGDGASDQPKPPVIVISAHLHTDPQAVLKMGAAAMLPKPIVLDDLLSLLEHLAR